MMQNVLAIDCTYIKLRPFRILQIDFVGLYLLRKLQ